MVPGYLNPDNVLGRQLKLDRQRSVDTLKAQIADPLGLSVEDATAGVTELLDSNLRGYTRAMISSKGYSPAAAILIGCLVASASPCELGLDVGRRS